MPDLNYIPPTQHDQAWALLRAMVITVIDEIKNSDASTDYVNDSIEDVSDFLVTASAAAPVTPRSHCLRPGESTTFLIGHFPGGG